MKLQVALATELPSPAVSKFFKQMAHNPNAGQFAAWLFKLPELKLPSIRPAIHLYLHRFMSKVTGTENVNNVFNAKERKLVHAYFASKSLTPAYIDQFIPFLVFMCKKVVDTSSTFRSHFGEAKTVSALLLLILTGEISTTATASVKALLSKVQAKSDTVFDPKSLSDISIEDLKNSEYNELEVAAKINRLTKDWLNSQVDVEKLERDHIAKGLRTLTETLRYGTNVVLTEDAADFTGHKVIDLAEAKRVIKANDGRSVLVSYTNSARQHSSVRISSASRKALAEQISPSVHMSLGNLKKFQKAFPDLASFFILCTPTFTSALNSAMPGEHYGLIKGSPEREGLVKEAWMAKYVSEKVLKNSKMRAAVDAHLWMRIQATPVAKLAELLKDKPKFSIEDIENLTVAALSRVVKIFGVEESLVSVFSNLHKEPLFKRKFLTASITSAVASPFGDIKTEHVKKNIGSSEALLSAASVAKWIPVKQPAAEFQQKIIRKIPDLNETSAADIPTVRLNLQKFLWGGHNVDFDVLRAWDIPLSGLQEKHLQKVSKDKDYFVIRDTFHGTSTSAAGAILTSGFRMSQEFVKTAQSMGPVLYIAPNIDKSLQYIGDSFGRDTVTGIIFHGDIVVHGAKAPSHTRSSDTLDWTLSDSYKTQEIGLLHPNYQFLVRRAYLVQRKHALTTTRSSSASKFSPLVPIANYLSEPVKSSSKQVQTTAWPYLLGDRVLARSGKNKWHIGTVSGLTPSAVSVLFDDEATAEVSPKDFKHLKILASAKRKNPAVLSDDEASTMRLSKRSPLPPTR